MKYLKYILPLVIAFGITLIFPIALGYPEVVNWINDNKLDFIVPVFIKGSLLLYFLRLNNNRSPFINSLSVALIIMTAGEYIIFYNFDIGQIFIYIGNLAFIILYLLRSKAKTSTDKLIFLKSVSVSLFAIANTLFILTEEYLILLILGYLLIFSVYFYDRLTKEGDKIPLT